MKLIDLNVDLGEGMVWDDELLDYASSANVCCGVHAGSAELTKETIVKCKEREVTVVAHPGYPDRENFGRKTLFDLNSSVISAIKESIIEQIEFIKSDIVAIKPHGAFYNDSTKSGFANEILLSLLKSSGLNLVGLYRSEHETLAKQACVKFFSEGFADRRYDKDGYLVPRSKENSCLTDEVEIREQVIWLAERVDTICLHGDHEGCVERIAFVRQSLEKCGFEVKSCH